MNARKLKQFLPCLCGCGLGLLLVLAGCGGSSGSGGGGGGGGNGSGNVQPVAVNGFQGLANGLFTTVTVCAPGTATCQAIPDVLVDTGSTGLRLLSSVATLALPQQTSGGNAVVECAQFLGGVTWGPVQMADVKMAGETASNISVQMINNSFGIPSSCSSHGTPMQTVGSLLANGILGVGNFLQDCGQACATSGSPGFYYACSSTAAASCQTIPEPLASQLQQPVAKFATDNNGLVVEMPALSTQPPTGSLIFGIGTQPNNALSGTVLTLDGRGNFSTVYRGTTYSGSFLDSGSNAIFFLDGPTSGITVCPNPNNFFYCPASPQMISAVNKGMNNAMADASFTVVNANTLFNTPGAIGFNQLAGPNTTAPGSPATNFFDYGMSFFYGKNVFVGIEGQVAGGNVGPFVSY